MHTYVHTYIPTYIHIHRMYAGIHVFAYEVHAYILKHIHMIYIYIYIYLVRTLTHVSHSFPLGPLGPRAGHARPAAGRPLHAVGAGPAAGPRGASGAEAGRRWGISV